MNRSWTLTRWKSNWLKIKLLKCSNIYSYLFSYDLWPLRLFAIIITFWTISNIEITSFVTSIKFSPIRKHLIPPVPSDSFHQHWTVHASIMRPLRNGIPIERKSRIRLGRNDERRKDGRRTIGKNRWRPSSLIRYEAELNPVSGRMTRGYRVKRGVQRCVTAD